MDEKSPLANVQLTEVREALGLEEVVVAAIVRGEKLIIPSGTDRIAEKDIVYLVCKDKGLDKISRSLGTALSLESFALLEYLIDEHHKETEK